MRTELFARARHGPLNPINSCILIMDDGGPSHFDAWDMKPGATAQVRGEFQPISAGVPRRFVCQGLPKRAEIVGRLAVIQAMHNRMTSHHLAMYESLLADFDPAARGAQHEIDFGDADVAVWNAVVLPYGDRPNSPNSLDL